MYRLAIPLPDNPLGSVNAYAVVAPDGLRLIDCGWNTPEAHAALTAQLEALGCSIRDIREILVTHIHPDHFGLAARLAEESGARVSMHRLEAIYIGARYEHTRALVEEMDAWLRINGVPSPELETMTAGSLQMIRWVGTRRPDVLLEGGEVLEWGPFRFEVLWTPGHSAGLVCLHDADRRILVSNDHVLERISPHIGMHAQSLGSPLANYLASLEMVRDLPVTIVLPGHGAPFRDLPGRVDQLIAHHRARLAVMLDLLHGGERTAYWVAGHLRWRGSESGWERLEPFQRRMALTETIAHLEYLYGAGQLGKHFRGGLAYYCPVQTLPGS